MEAFLEMYNLTGYFEKLYRNGKSISFSFAEPMVAGGCGYVSWEMNFSHKRLAGGRTIRVDGVTHIKMDGAGKVYYHRDYFDLGEMVYEHVTFLGRLIRLIKNVSQASAYIRRGLAGRQAEIHFPRRFTYILKKLSLLPGPLWTWIGKRMVRK